jgi:hypothetical protein
LCSFTHLLLYPFSQIHPAVILFHLFVHSKVAWIYSFSLSCILSFSIFFASAVF